MKKLSELERLLQSNTTQLFIEESGQSDESFERRNLLSILSSAIFMIAGPLFIYFGFYILTSPFTVKWGALSIAIGMFVLMFGFSLWQDRQIQIQWRLIRKEHEKTRVLMQEIAENRK